MVELVVGCGNRFCGSHLGLSSDGEEEIRRGGSDEGGSEFGKEEQEAAGARVLARVAVGGKSCIGEAIASEIR